jgi:hypothetical protein
MEVATAEDDSSDISWSSDNPDVPTPEEKAAEQRVLVLVDSFETLEKADDAVNETLQWCLIADAAMHQALAIAQRRERQAAAEKQKREGGDEGARLLSALRDSK